MRRRPKSFRSGHVADVVACERTAGELQRRREGLGHEDGSGRRDRLDPGGPADVRAHERVRPEDGAGRSAENALAARRIVVSTTVPGETTGIAFLITRQVLGHVCMRPRR
jgi:hypothetical protein